MNDTNGLIRNDISLLNQIPFQNQHSIFLDSFLLLFITLGNFPKTLIPSILSFNNGSLKYKDSMHFSI